MASGVSYRRFPQGTAFVFPLGSAANPPILLGNDNLHGGLNDGIYGTTGPGIGLSINGTSVAVFDVNTLTASLGLLSTNATRGVGYAAGAGGAVTQITTAATPVTLNKITGQITTVALTTAAAAEERFTVNNTTVAATDTIALGTTYNGAGTPMLGVVNVTAGAFDIVITNLHGANALNAVMVINFAVVKAVAA